MISFIQQVLFLVEATARQLAGKFAASCQLSQ